MKTGNPGALQGTQAAIEQLQKAIEALAKPSSVAAEHKGMEGADGPKRRARGPTHSAEVMDWLRSDLVGRSLGLDAMAYVDLAPLADPAEVDRRAAISQGTALPWPEVARKDSYRLDELTGFHDEAFVRNAYLAMLRRDPSMEEIRSWIDSLHTGRLSRQEMLGVLRFSEEGRKANVAVAGLRTALVLRRLRKVPIIGRLVGIAQYVVQLPLIVRNLELLDATAHRHNWKLQVGLHGVREELRVLDRLEELEAAAARVNAAAMRERIAAIQKSEMALRAWVGAFAEHLLDLRRQATELGRRVDLDASRAEMLAISSRMLEGVMALQERQSEITREQDKASQANERLDQLVSDWAANQDALELMKVNMRSLTVRKATAAVPDSFYADFEDAFRGKREDIKSRVAVYLPLVKAASKATGTAPVLDVGCGRGEWLELLTDSGIPATGIDSNIAMAQRCRDLKLDVMEGDGVAHLRSLESASLTAVTAIHIIEHLPFGDLLSLFAEAFRVLRPGGVIIFETPNPENVLVGACNFWFDPTHVKPLPPEMMRYVAREKGFDRVEILPLHPYSEAERLPEYADEGLQRRINHLFYGPQDYAVVGYKP